METPQGAVPEMRNFKDTLRLPQTDFPLRADAAINDPLMLQRWDREQLCARAQECHHGAQKFVLHDGPPYANGHIHLGHAYNKILKDIIAKSHRMMGMQTTVVPGWDCHGLPIDHKVSQEHPGLKGAEFKAACRQYAAHWMGVQREEFKRLGVLMDWENPYLTMNPGYESAIVHAFGEMVERGFIERKNKTIPWCFTCKTALASAEIEYQDRKDPSLYVLFRLTEDDQKKLIAQGALPSITAPVHFLVWTTTPWTLPLNRAVLLREGIAYQVLKRGDVYFVAAKERVSALMQQCDAERTADWDVIATVDASVFAGSRVHHPFDDHRLCPIIFDLSVGVDEGTACVHCAPGCGPSDYEVGVKHGLEIYSPLAADGTYTPGVIPASLTGVRIVDAQGMVISALQERGVLLFKGSIRHSYPHCWRCHEGLMFRATPQWFCSLEHRDARAKALACVEKITFIPEQGKNFLRATIENRWEWCLSRQRAWGTPIVALVSHDGMSVYLDADFIKKVSAKIALEGIEYWDRVTMQELVAQGMLPHDFPITDYRKETDILDVWFDAGVSHAAVVRQDARLQFPADLYLEGLDQHRGWFQSSLLTSVLLNEVAPMRAIMTHGFTVDEKGRKMSKSLGNVVAPDEIIKRLGTDGLRLWVASIGNEGDAVVSDRLLVHVEQVYRKVRNTCRFLLQNLYDFDARRDALAIDQLTPFDRYALVQVWRLQEKVIDAYRACNVTAVFHLVGDYCTGELSAFYADIVKDRLYCDAENGHERRSTQTALWMILDALTRLIAPVLSFTAEQVADHYQAADHQSIHLQTFFAWKNPEQLYGGVDPVSFDAQWKFLKELRSALLKLIEEQRAAGIVRHPLEAAVTLSSDALSGLTVIDDPEAFLRMFLIASQVTIVAGRDVHDAALRPTALDGVSAKVMRATGTKCPRCWQWGDYAHADTLCSRCAAICE